MADLITRAYATQALQADGTITSTENSIIDALTAAVSSAVRKYCRRDFDSRSYDELYDGGAEEIVLRHYPVQSVTSVRCNPASVLEVCNTLTTTNQQATVEVRSTGLALTRIASGVSSTDTSVTFATYPTLQGCADAVAALGNGWAARVAGSPTGDYGLWPSSDLYVTPDLGDGTKSMGALDCRGNYAPLRMHVDGLTDYAWLPRGVLYRAWELAWPAGLGAWDLRRPFPGGRGYYRVRYLAGYTSVPEAVQTACAEWLRQLYFAWKRDPSVANEVNVGSTSYAYRLPEQAPMPALVKQLLAPFVRRSV
jgi:hypothetical protein